MADMQGKIVMVTGATNGVGKETARELARMGATVILVGRSATKGADVLADIRNDTGSTSLDFMQADLSSMAEIRKLAETFKAKYDRLDVLVNNAGAVFMSRHETVDGFEMTFGLNHMGYFLLTNLLLDTLKASAPARIVSVSSNAHYRGNLDFDDLQYAKRRFVGFSVYSDSKLANVVFTYELARRLEGTGVTANALHPGFVRSGFGHNNNRLVNAAMSVIQRFGGISEKDGARTSIYLASSPEVEGVSGTFYDEKAQQRRSSDLSYDQSTWTRLWAVSEELAGMKAAV